jgi:hypothetical protein
MRFYTEVLFNLEMEDVATKTRGRGLPGREGSKVRMEGWEGKSGQNFFRH